MEQMELSATLRFSKEAQNLKSKMKFEDNQTLQQTMINKKIVLLILDFNNDDMLADLDKCFMDDKVSKLIKDHYLLLGWHMQDKQTHLWLKGVLMKFEILDCNDFFQTETSVILLIRPDKRYAYIANGCLNENDFYQVLSETVKFSTELPPKRMLEGRYCNDSLDFENIATSRFVTYFTSKYDNGLKFQTELTLEEALAEGKVAIFYIHFKNDNLLETFNKCLTGPQVKKAIENNCLLLGWDLEQEDFSNILREVLSKQKFFEINLEFFDARQSAILVIVPSRECLVVTDAEMKEDDFLNVLADQIETNYIELMKNKPTAREFQQSTMNNYFLHGQRDYDNYEHDELEELKKTIGYALYGPPTKLKGYADDCKKRINFLYEKILVENNELSKYKNRVLIFMIFVCTEPLDSVKETREKINKYYKPDKDWSKRVVFVLRKCKTKKLKIHPCQIFIDDLGRVYKDWDDYLNNNKLEKCNMIFPRDGRYQEDENYKVILDTCQSPACGIKIQIKSFVETAGLVSGVAALGITIASVAFAVPVIGTGALIGGAVSAVASVGTSSWNIFDRKERKEDVSFANSEARFEYLNLAAGCFGVLGGAANTVLGQLVARGFNVGRGAQYTVNAINVTSLAIFGANIANDAFTMLGDYIVEDRSPSPLALAQLSVSILFFGHSVYNFQTISGVIDETQAKILNDYEASLSSKRQKKMFTKLRKETIRQNSGQVQKGRAEVIKFLTNLEDNDKIFSKLASSKKTMNKNGVKFSAENGQLKLNGVLVDMNKFNKMTKSQIGKFVTNLPTNSTAAQPLPTEVQLTNANSWLSTTFTDICFDCDWTEKCLLLLNNPKEEVMKIIIDVSKQLMQMIKDQFSFTNVDRILEVFEIVAEWIHDKIAEIEHDYKKWKETGDRNLEKWYFPYLPMNDLERLDEIFQLVVKIICVDKQLTSESLDDLKQYFLAATANNVVNEITEEDRKKKRKEKRNQYTHGDNLTRIKTDCDVCQGYYYIPN